MKLLVAFAGVLFNAKKNIYIWVPIEQKLKILNCKALYDFLQKSKRSSGCSQYIVAFLYLT